VLKRTVYTHPPPGSPCNGDVHCQPVAVPEGYLVSLRPEDWPSRLGAGGGVQCAACMGLFWLVCWRTSRPSCPALETLEKLIVEQEDRVMLLHLVLWNWEQKRHYLTPKAAASIFLSCLHWS
jgi:hypothetical protein